MEKAVDVAAPNSLVLLMDQSIGAVPDEMGVASISATRSCIAVGTRSEQDGPTRIILSDELDASRPEGELMFDGELETPAGRLAVCSVLDEELLGIPVRSHPTRVRIWANDRFEPDKIHILVSAVE